MKYEERVAEAPGQALRPGQCRLPARPEGVRASPTGAGWKPTLPQRETARGFCNCLKSAKHER
jgi:hypothetical protein